MLSVAKEQFFKVRCAFCSTEVPVRVRALILEDGSLEIAMDDYYHNGVLFHETHHPEEDAYDKS